MNDRELMQMALDALEYCVPSGHGPTELYDDAIEALRAALAQPEPKAQFEFQEYGPPNWDDSQVTKPEFVAEQKAMNEGLRKMVEQEEDYDAIANKQLASLKAAAKVTFEDAVVRAVHKLYNAPPQREWVGLTDEEHTQIAIDCGCLSADWVFYGAAVERKLKEKNT